MGAHVASIEVVLYGCNDERQKVPMSLYFEPTMFSECF